MQKYKMWLKDEDGEAYEYTYHDFQWTDGGPLLLFDYAGIGAEGSKKMTLKAKFQNCRAILEIVEVDDEG